MRSASRQWMEYLALALCAAAIAVVVLTDDPTLGILLGIAASTVAIVAFIRRQALRAQRWFVHGYHAGYHAGSSSVDCFGPSCAILDMAQDRVHQTVDIAGD